MTRTVVIPMFNETGRIGATLKLIAASPLHGAEIILVDDGSTDGTPEVARSILAECGLAGQVVELGCNMGKGAAIRAGIAIASGDAIAFCDADLSTPTSEIVTCLALIESGAADMVAATRLDENSTILVTQNFFRRWSGKIFNILLRALGLTSRADTQCGLKAFNEKAASIVFRDQRINRFAFDVELIVRAERAGLRVLEVPVVWSHHDQSRVRPIRDGIQMAIDVMRLRLMLRSESAAQDPCSMGDERFEVMARLEQEHWWFRAKRRLVISLLGRLQPANSSLEGPVLDVGCGTGELLKSLSDCGYGPVIGTDASATAVTFSNNVADSPGSTLRAFAEHLPFPDGTFCLLTSLDVVEHLDDDVLALREYRRVTRPNGTIIIAVPAYQWAWSNHDVSLGHRRRYTAKRLITACRLAGLEVDHVTYYHSWLVPLAFLLRKTPLGKLQKASAEEASFVHPVVNRAFVAITDIERVLAVRAKVPFGLSILIAAHRPGLGSAIYSPVA